MTESRQPVRRRTAIKASACILAATSGCLGGENGDPTDTDDPTESTGETDADRSATSGDAEPALDAVEYFTVNTIGSRTGGGDPLYEYGYRSEAPFRMETDVGGTVASRNRDDGISLQLDLTAEDGYGAAGVQSRVRMLDEVSRIRFRADQDLFVVLQLGIEYTGETILEYESVGDSRERTVGLGGDETWLAGRLDGPSVTIQRDDQVFSQAQSDTRRSIADLTDTHGNVPSRLVVALDGGGVPWAPDERARSTVLTELGI